MEKLTKEFLGQIYTYQNTDGEFVIWDDSERSSFNRWLRGLEVKIPSLFYVNIPIHSGAIDLFNEIFREEKIESKLPSLVEYFNEKIESKRDGEEWTTIKRNLNSEMAKRISTGEMTHKNVHFSAEGMNKLNTISNIMGKSMSEIAQGAFYCVLLLYSLDSIKAA